MLLALTLACALSDHPEEQALLSSPAATTWQALLAGPAVIEHEAVISARWQVPLSGLVDLDDPRARDLPEGDVPIVLPIHVLRHPVAGTFIVDTGVDRDLAAGGHGALGPPVRPFLGSMEAVQSLGAVLARQAAPLSGVVLTHLHLDHVLGLPDVPADVPLYVGAGEQTVRKAEHALLSGTYGTLLAGRRPLQVVSPAQGAVVEGMPVVDLVGDGSLLLLPSPGHTPGSLAVLALSTDGPVLLTGDTCHTRWGWQQGVSPGSFTADPAGNAASLKALRDLVAAHPAIQVFVGHELDGVGTGVEAMATGG